MDYVEKPLLMPCQGQTLVGILSEPLQSGVADKVGVLVVVGGPQYRVGSHRQFVLLCRALAKAGVAAMRFDFRGMGDSSGAMRRFDAVNEDIACAVDAFFCARPNTEKLVLWALCDGATAASFYAATDPRIAGLVLLNPWVRTEEGQARALITHYYRDRIFSKDLWLKVLGGKFNFRDSLASLTGTVKKLASPSAAATQSTPQTLPEKLLHALSRSASPILTLLSGRDIVAAEFQRAVASTEQWSAWLASGRVQTQTLESADHTFSANAWSREVERATIDWVKQQGA